MSVKSEMLLPKLTRPQKLGSAITYYRRYTYSLYLVYRQDDDGNKASAPVKIPTLTEDNLTKCAVRHQRNVTTLKILITDGKILATKR
jgi:hypothetical protein